MKVKNKETGKIYNAELDRQCIYKVGDELYYVLDTGESIPARDFWAHYEEVSK